MLFIFIHLLWLLRTLDRNYTAHLHGHYAFRNVSVMPMKTIIVPYIWSFKKHIYLWTIFHGFVKHAVFVMLISCHISLLWTFFCLLGHSLTISYIPEYCTAHGLTIICVVNSLTTNPSDPHRCPFYRNQSGECVDKWMCLTAVIIKTHLPFKQHILL